ncbi:PAS domain-containing protein [Nitrospiraceae bacterium HYJII51-Mn-bac16s-1-B09]|uniref:histidine kinase n=1 Tax=Candidatus Manganitrophus noduliformans TaxID=2606439 RepID=A0A7X6DVE4_9BACT|nr:PAS domain-containing protein [Candidatus Manganitrophus noduliformans]
MERSHQEIEALKDQLRLVIDTIPVLVVVGRPDASLEFINRRWLEYLGLSSKEVEGWGWTAAIHPEDAQRFTTEWRLAMTSGKPFEQEARIRRADGEYRWFLHRGVPLRDEWGNIVRWYATSTDIEDRKRAEAALQEAQTELAHVTRVTTLGELAASIAHEVNQPLSGVVINGNACLRWLAFATPNLEEARQAVDRIVRDGKRAGEIIGRIRKLLRRTATQKERLDINDTVLEIAVLAQGEVRRNKIALRMELAPDLPPVLGDRVQLQQVLLNLIMNGIEAMNRVDDRPRELVIRTDFGETDQVRVAVQDSGIGLEPQHIEKIFDAFYTTKSEGMGMGLAISRSIVENHGGRLWAAPNNDSGATFLVTFLKHP